MKEYVLSYYPNFKCIAGKCKHTCCAGWEMNIDSDSLTAYQNDRSDFYPTLKRGINFRKSKFKYDKNKRCAFLNDKGLCEIITNIGEKSLCQVCRDHPRFRSFFDDRVEMGLGFCCEESARIILLYEDKIEPILKNDDDKNTVFNINQKFLLEFRQKALDILQDRTTTINNRIETLLRLCSADMHSKNDKRVLNTFLSFERLDKGWTKRLKNIKGQPLLKDTDDAYSLYCEQFLVNSLYRHLYDAEDTMWARAKTIGCVISWWIIQSVLAQEKMAEKEELDLLIDIVRAFSAEVEYSQKNLNKLFDFCYDFIKI